MLKYILSFLIILIAWGAWFGLGAAGVAPSYWVPAAITIVVLLVLVALVVVRKIRARRAAAQLEKALAEQAAMHAQSARPDLQAEILEMQAEFEKAVSALKSSKLGSGKDALYALPWQIIIGPPGAGKTTALRNSGLQFPYLSAKTGGAVRGLGGTRNCDWWLTNEAVILDTAGRWTTEDEDREEWMGFLDLVKKFRPRKPLNGIIAAVSIEDLGGATEDEVTALAQKIRERIDEAMNRLQMSLPVYVLFTKSDLIPGFVETFGDLSKNDRGQVWGFTVPMSSGAVGDHFHSHYEQIINQIEGRMLARMSDERKVETREMLYVFPRQLEALRNNLTAFTSQLFEENVFRETPIYRGAYFTSGTQEGNPIDRVMGRMAEAFGIQSALPVSQTPTTPKSYFLRDVFREVIFKDYDLAVRSEAELRRQKRLRYMVAAAVLALAVLLLTLPAYSWARNRAALQETADSLSVPPEPEPVAGVQPPLAPKALNTLHDRVEGLEEGAPLSQGFGMYRGDTVEDPLRDYYTDALKNRVVEPLVDNLKRDLNAFGQEYEALRLESPTREEFDTNRRRLRSYLLLTTPVEANQPEWDDELINDLTGDMTRRWAKALNEDPSSPETKQAAEQMRWFVERLAANPSKVAFPRGKTLVQRARSGLTRVSTVELAVEGFVNQFDGRGLDLTLERIVGRRLTGMSASKGVRAAFTKRVYLAAIRKQLQSSVDSLTGEPWVVGDLSSRTDTEQEQQERIAAVREQYFRSYVEEWNRFLRSVRVNRPNNNREALDITYFMTAGEPPPLRALFNATKENTILYTPEELAAANASDSAAGKAAQKGVTDQLKRAASKSAAGRIASRVLGGAASDIGQTKSDAIDEGYVKRSFDGFTRFGVPPTPAKGQSAQSTDLDSYQEELLSVRYALENHFDDPSEPEVMMEKIQKARTVTKGLIREQEVGWRPVFEAVLWPPIDGASMGASKEIAQGTGRSWCDEVVRPYDSTVDGLYPFDQAGHDMSFDDFAAFYGPEGTLWSFYNDVLKTHVDRRGDQFEFVRRLGRSEGQVFQGSLLRFLERSHDITASFFPPGGEGPRVDFDMRINPSPRVAIQTVTIGGKAVEYHNGPEEWHRLSWPGEEAPGAGATIEIRGEGGMHERIEQMGEWGLFHLLERGTVVSGAGSRVFTVVWHLRTHNVDIAVDFRPVRADTPFFGAAANRSNSLMNPVRTRNVDVPREIVSDGRTCPVRRRGT